MASSQWLDIAVLALAFIGAISGWRSGALGSLLSFIGVALGAMTGILLVPYLITLVHDSHLQLFVALFSILFMVIIGEVAGIVLGKAVRSAIRNHTIRFIDSLIGTGLQLAVVLLASWLVAIPMTTSEHSSFTVAIRESRILGQVDQFSPPWLKNIPRRLAAVVDQSGLPDVFEPFHHEPSEASTPNPALASSPIIDTTEPSVLRVRGVAPNCRKILEGTGFVISQDRVMTNAHVVAGADSVVVESGTNSYNAIVISFDPQEDISILAVPGLPIAPLKFVTDPSTNDSDAIVLGYPGGGVFEATPVRIRGIINLEGPNIYHSQTVTRQVYNVRGSIQQGNSGGPMIDIHGRVLGVVFGAAVDDDDTGFVMTAKEVAPQLEKSNSDQPVSTQECVSWSE